MNAPDGRDALVARVHAFLDGSLRGAPPEPFDTLAVAISRWQVDHDPVLAALAEDPVDAFADVPAVPVGLFKQLPVGTVKDDPAPVCFRTSGTTGSGRGVHRLRDTALYDHGAVAWARRMVPDLSADVVALLDDPADAPDSSLSHMVARFPGATGSVSWHVRDGVLDRDGLDRALASAVGPVFVASTAFALAEWLDGDVSALPPGSLVMVTGGFKGRTTALSDDDLYAAAKARLAPRRVVTEYGMTELSSQLWGHPGDAYRGPPWLRAVAVDPASGVPVPRGTAGQLRFYDLCNVDSTVGVETLDVGVVHGDGAVTLHGRLEGADRRGCSLTVEEAWARRPSDPTT
ncbi:MAG: acyl-protein synthetase [Alphaproteobacteria bacterium]|nr:acyl-protein synthetase [Alphaproteobacteria bacterium]